MLGEGEARRLRPEGGGAGELRGEQPVAQPLAALLPHAAHGKRHRLDVSSTQISNRESTIGGSSLWFCGVVKPLLLRISGAHVHTDCCLTVSCRTS